MGNLSCSKKSTKNKLVNSIWDKWVFETQENKKERQLLVLRLLGTNILVYESLAVN